MITAGINTSDLTAKARIRMEALALFAAHGTERVSLRQVAAAAGVAVGSIQHHFGTRDGLLDAVDALVVECFRDAIESVRASGGAAAITAARDAAVHAMLAANPAVVSYVRREALDPASDGRLLRRLTELTLAEVRRARAGGIASTARRESAQVIQIIVRQIGSLALQPLVDRVWAQLEPGAAQAGKPVLRVVTLDGAERSPRAAAPGTAA